MNKKRKVSSPAQGQSELSVVSDDLKKFIAEENEKCVKQIKDSNERRLTAMEESLSFTMDSLAALSDRQRSADIDIVQLQGETADLRRRLQQLELSDDRQQQEKRLTSLIFSGPSLQQQASRDGAARVIETTIQRYLSHSLDRAQLKSLIRLRNGKVLVEFSTAAPGSDRDTIFRSKTKLRGSGLFVAESLTPRRQELFSSLLKLKKEGRIFSVFTRSGNVLACRSRDTAPVRVVDAETVQRMAGGGGGAADRPAQGRAQERERGVTPDEAAALLPPLRAPTPAAAARLGGGDDMELDERGGDEISPAHHASPPGSQRRDEFASPAISRDSANGRRPGSSLLDCARESTVHLVHLSPPLQEGTASPGGADRAPAVVPNGASATTGNQDGVNSSAGLRSSGHSPGTDGLEPPLPISPVSFAAPARSPGESGGEPGRGGGPPGGEGTAPTSSGQPSERQAPQSKGNGVSFQTDGGGGPGSRIRNEGEGGVSDATVSGRASARSLSSGKPKGNCVSAGSRDIREFF